MESTFGGCEINSHMFQRTNYHEHIQIVVDSQFNLTWD